MKVDGELRVYPGHRLVIGPYEAEAGSLLVEISNTSGDGLIMTNANSRVDISGNASFAVSCGNSSATSQGNFTNGQINVGGSFYQTRCDSGTSGRSFRSTGTKVIMDGASGTQTVYFYRPGFGDNYSYFDDLRFENASQSSNHIYVNGDLEVVDGTLVNIPSNYDVYVNGDLSITGASSLLQGGSGTEVRVEGDAAISASGELRTGNCYFDGNIDVSSATMNCTNAYYMEQLPVFDGGTYTNTNQYVSDDIVMSRNTNIPGTTRLQVQSGKQLDLNGKTLEVGSISYQISNITGDGLKMTNASSTLISRGKIYATSACGNSSATSEGNFSAGTIYVGGDFQTQRCDSSSARRQFISTGTKVIFNGSGSQSITFESSDTAKSRFHAVDFSGGNTVTINGTLQTLTATGQVRVLNGSVLNINSNAGVDFRGGTVVDGSTLQKGGSYYECTYRGGTTLMNSATFTASTNTYVYDSLTISGSSSFTGTNVYYYDELPVIDTDTSTYSVSWNYSRGSLVMDQDLTVPGNFRIDSASSLRLAGNTLTISGKLYTLITNASGDGLIMTNANDVFYVQGDAEFSSQGGNTSATTSGYLTNGTLYVTGNFIQSRPYGDCSYYSFVASGNHKVVLNGTAAQSVSFATSTESRSHFHHLDFANTGSAQANFNYDTIIKGDVSFASDADAYLNSNVDVVVKGDLSMTGAELTGQSSASLRVEGDMSMTASSNFNLGALRHYEDLVITDSSFGATNVYSSTRLPELSNSTYVVPDTRTAGAVVMVKNLTFPDTADRIRVEGGTTLRLNGFTLDTGDDFYGFITNTSGDGLIMTNANDVLIVGDRAYFQGVGGNTSATTEGNLTAGEIRVAGNFDQAKPYTDCTTRSFVSTGTKVVFDGSSSQTISFLNPSASYSYFDDVEIQNTTGVTLNGSYNGYAKGDITLTSGAKLTVPSNRTFWIDGDLTATNATLTITGLVDVDGDTHFTGGTAVSMTATSTYRGTMVVDGGSSVTGATVVVTSAIPDVDTSDSTYNVTTTEVRGNTTMTKDAELTGTSSLTIRDGNYLNLAGYTLEIPNDFTAYITNTSGSGLRMQNASDLLIVGDRATFTGEGGNTSATSQGYLSNGEIRVQGHFYQTSPYADVSKKGFISTGTQVTFNGTSAQTISFSDPGASYSYFDDVSITNTAGVSLSGSYNAYSKGNVSVTGGGKLTVPTSRTFTILGDLSANAATLTLTGLVDVTGDTTISGGSNVSMTATSKLRGAIDVQGSSTVTGTQVNVYSALPDIDSSTWSVTKTYVEGSITMGKSMTLPGELRVNPSHNGVFLALNGNTLDLGGNLYAYISNTSGDGLRMTNSSDVLEVGGNAYFEGCAGNSSGTTEGYLTQGELRLSGNFQQTSPYGDCTRRSFVSTGTTVVFEKNGTQSVSFADASASYSYFKHVRVAASSTVNFNNTTYSKGDVDVYGHLHGQSGTDTVTGNMTLRDGSTLTNTSSTFTGLSGCTKESGHTINGTDPCP